MKLEVGMYVRTNKIGIKKIYEIDNNKTKYKYLYKLKNQDDDGCIDLGALSDDNIIKEPSFDIIELIEAGDYVNGHEVKSKQSGVKRIDIGEDENYVWLYEKDIKSVITREQMERMTYKVGE